MIFQGGYQRFRAALQKYERLLMPGMLLFGVAADFFTFTHINIRTAFLILGIYAVLAAISIVVLSHVDTYRGWRKRRFITLCQMLAPFVMQFTFGALWSASLVFYWFSGAFSVSWPIMIILAGLMVSNDVLRHYYLRPSVQIGVYYFAIFSYFILLFPYVFDSISALVFVLSGLASLIIILPFTVFLEMTKRTLRYKRKVIFTVVFTIYAVMNGFYFLNVIPPIPLSLRSAYMAHDVQHVGNAYEVLVEERSWFESFGNPVMHMTESENLYAFVSVFAPADISVPVVHVWEHFDESSRTWKEFFRVSYDVTGGREEGYRGYSVSQHPQEGKWRVNIETERGQIIGRVKFSVEMVDVVPELELLGL